MTQPHDPGPPPPRPDRAAAIRAALEEMRSEYRAVVPQQLDEIAVHLAQARSGGDEASVAEALTQMRRLAHRIRGTAGSFGWVSLSQAAGAIEDALEEGAVSLPDETTLHLAAALEEARAAVAVGLS
ncbi:Hpt domain-containing protein [Chondromyces crocatus]|uniref:HPt domain-containing protein n=1 Tax=Chondromyces crocatus TaxID=52 RepID=A0A0K1ESV1_CHOCO|nr:Hpt domain-containing protein [Chondromyces crocatus]AKT43717.1 uncharacterized protein CMC5_079520 [Chondromyces crocatus]